MKHQPSLAGRQGLTCLQRHLHALEYRDRIALGQRHDGLLPRRLHSRPRAEALAFTSGLHRVDLDHRHVERFLHRLPDLIFIGHAGNSEIANYIKTVLAPFLIPHEVVECDYDAAWPVSDDVSKQMRQCNSAIFIFADPTDSSWVGRRKERRNEKMLYQLGAASVLYGARVIALREEGASDSQGNTNGFHTMQFGRGNMPDVGLALLAELHRLGVIQVQA